jgi:hypothetical protein
MNRTGHRMSAHVTEMFQGLNKTMNRCLRKLEYTREFSLESPAWTGGEGFQKGETTLECGRMWGGECFH